MPSRIGHDHGSSPHHAGAPPLRADATPRPLGAARTVIAQGAAFRVPGTIPVARPSSAATVERSGVARVPPLGTVAQACPAVAAPHVIDRETPPRSTTPAPSRALAPTVDDRVRPDDLLPEVRRLLWYHLESVEKIRVLQHARRATQPWTVADVAVGLGLPERSVHVASIGLCQADLLKRAGDTYQATPKASFVGAALDVLQRAYGSDPRQLLLAIGRLAHGRSTV
jgi:hypothetical protein